MGERSGKEMGRHLASVVKGFCARSFAPIIARLKDLEAKVNAIKPEKGEKGDRGEPGIGERGVPGPAGRDAVDLAILPAIDSKVSYPRGTYARHANGLWRAFEDTLGMRGWECLVAGVASLSIDAPSERELVVTAMLSTGDKVEQQVRLSHPIDRGVYRPEEKYSKGDGVTFGGSWWIALNDGPLQKPGVVPPGEQPEWRLAVKRGRDGKDAK